jgi:hypothetical protein
VFVVLSDGYWYRVSVTGMVSQGNKYYDGDTEPMPCSWLAVDPRKLSCQDKELLRPHVLKKWLDF